MVGRYPTAFESLTRALFVPVEMTDARDLLAQRRPDTFLRHVVDLALSGSSWAKACLAYLVLRGEFRNAGNTDCALALTKNGALDGEPFSQHIHGWALLTVGDRAQANAWMQQSADSGFAPAALDIARIAGLGIDQTSSRFQGLARLVERAVASGHEYGPAFAAIVDARNGANAFRVRLGAAVVRLPMGLIGYSRALQQNTCGDRVFFYSTRRGSVFRDRVECPIADEGTWAALCA